MLGVFHQRAFGQFHFKPVGLAPRACKGARHIGNQVAFDQLMAGEVDRHLHRANRIALPLCDTLAVLLDHPTAHGDDQADIIKLNEVKRLINR